MKTPKNKSLKSKSLEIKTLKIKSAIKSAGVAGLNHNRRLCA